MKLLNLQSIASVQGGTFHLMSYVRKKEENNNNNKNYDVETFTQRESRTQLISLIFRRGIQKIFPGENSFYSNKILNCFFIVYRTMSRYSERRYVL